MYYTDRSLSLVLRCLALVSSYVAQQPNWLTTLALSVRFGIIFDALFWNQLIRLVSKSSSSIVVVFNRLSLYISWPYKTRQQMQNAHSNNDGARILLSRSDLARHCSLLELQRQTRSFATQQHFSRKLFYLRTGKLHARSFLYAVIYITIDIHYQRQLERLELLLSMLFVPIVGRHNE